MLISYHFYLNRKRVRVLLIFVKSYAYNYQQASIKINYKNLLYKYDAAPFSHGAATCNIYPVPIIS